MSDAFLKGKLKRWNDDKGFGFIKTNDGNQDVFIHISALKNMSRRPIEGDFIFYQLQTESNGKKKAVNAKIEGLSSINTNPNTLSLKSIDKKIDNVVPMKRQVTPRKVTTTNSNFFSKLIFLGIFVFAGLFIYNNFSQENVSLITSKKPITSTTKTPTISTLKRTYHCNGKTYCSEMTSCEEATFYVNNCPNTKMDGDGDGVPCERQWCG